MKKTFLEKQIKIKRLKSKDENCPSISKYAVCIGKDQTNDGSIMLKGGVKQTFPQWIYTIKIYSEITYEDLVVGLIREKYTENDENSILRKKLAGIDVKNEFEEYNTFAEDCKKKARAFIDERSTLLWQIKLS